MLSLSALFKKATRLKYRIIPEITKGKAITLEPGNFDFGTAYYKAVRRDRDTWEILAVASRSMIVPAFGPIVVRAPLVYNERNEVSICFTHSPIQTQAWLVNNPMTRQIADKLLPVKPRAETGPSPYVR